MYFSKCRVEYKCKLTSELKLKIHTEGFFFFLKIVYMYLSLALKACSNLHSIFILDSPQCLWRQDIYRGSGCPKSNGMSCK